VETVGGWRIPCYGMLRRVTVVKTDVSKESTVFTIRVIKISSLMTTLAVTCNRSTLRKNTSVLTRATRRNIPEDGIFHSHRRENLKSSLRGDMHSYCYVFTVLNWALVHFNFLNHVALRINQSQSLYSHTGQYKQNTSTDIGASSRLRTHDPQFERVVVINSCT
jgi:hypothetical protein